MFNRSVVLLFLVGVALAAAGSIADPMLKSGQARFNWGSNGRIVGGNTADPGQFPHKVSLRLIGIYHTCGGAIIADRWVLTAAHCTFGWPLESLSITAGAHHLYEDGENYLISAIVIHPEYNDENLFNDISLVQVQRPFVLSNRIAIIGFGSAEPIGVGLTARSSGWGSTALYGEESEYLQFLDFITLGNLDCASRHTTFSRLVTDGTMCAFSMSREHGMCHGDNGSPLVINGELAGIFSWGEPCATGRPDAFTRVSYYYNWINENLS